MKLVLKNDLSCLNPLAFLCLLAITSIFFMGCDKKNELTPVEDKNSQNKINEILATRSFETDAFITEWIVPAQTTIKLPLVDGYSYKFVVDWGDETPISVVDSFNHPDASHTYMNAGIFQIRIIGICETWRWDDTPEWEHRKYLTKVIQWGKVNTTDFYRSYNGCTGLTSIPAEMPNVENYGQVFRNCTSLSSLPQGLFANCFKAVFLDNVFSGCKNLRTLPSGLFDDTPAVAGFNGTFFGCGLLFIPSGLFDNCIAVTSFSNTFNGCENLSAIPNGIFAHNSEARIFQYVFKNCKSLTTIPLGLFDHCKKVIISSQVFAGCSNLTGTTPKTNGYELWQRVGLAGYPTSIIGIKCFSGCVNLSNYNDIPANWK